MSKRKIEFNSIEEADIRLKKCNDAIHKGIKVGVNLLNPITLIKQLGSRLMEWETAPVHIFNLFLLLFVPLIYIVVCICVLNNYLKLYKNNRDYKKVVKTLIKNNQK